MTWNDLCIYLLFGWVLPTDILLLFYLWYGRTRSEGYHVAYRAKDILRCTIPFVNIFAAAFAILIVLGDFFMWIEELLWPYVKDGAFIQWWNKKMSDYQKSLKDNE